MTLTSVSYGLMLQAAVQLGIRIAAGVLDNERRHCLSCLAKLGISDVLVDRVGH